MVGSRRKCVLIFQASQADNSQRFREVKKGDISMLCTKMRPSF